VNFKTALAYCSLLSMLLVAGCSSDLQAKSRKTPKDITLDLGKGLKMKFVLIDAGKFMMGSAETQPGRDDDEGPVHEVTISKPFYMGVCGVTQAQWRAVMGTAPWDGKADAKSDPNNAASYISWDDSSAFCKAMSKKFRKTVSLPTEAQREYACRAGTKTAYYFGDDPVKLGDHAWFHDNADGKDEKYAHPAGKKKPNPWGLYDMHGNVYEWCLDTYVKDFYANSPGVDPVCTAKADVRVIRGGSWRWLKQHTRSANRVRNKHSRRHYDYGLRVIVKLDAGAKR
jgi:formylglycine-generating enzyme required for sulfatase activity